MKKVLKDELNEDLKNVLNSDKAFNDMSEEEIKLIYSQIKDFYAKDEGKTFNVVYFIMSYLYKLNGEGVVSFIKNNVSGRDLASQILLTSGINDCASYYSGRGVNYGDLNDNNLTAIFEKLLKIDKNYASEFVNMVQSMKTLGATEFITSFKNFGANGFKMEGLNLQNNNISLDDVYGKSRDVIGFISFFSTLERGDDINYQISASESMKRSFISKIRLIIAKNNLKFVSSNEFNDINKSFIKRK